MRTNNSRFSHVQVSKPTFMSNPADKNPEVQKFYSSLYTPDKVRRGTKGKLADLQVSFLINSGIPMDKMCSHFISFSSEMPEISRNPSAS